MKKLLLLIALITISTSSIAQKFQREEIEEINGAVLRKSQQLYYHEYLAWYSSNNANSAGVKDIKGYIILDNSEGFPTIIFYDNNIENCLFSQCFNLAKSRLEEHDTTKRPLTNQEINLINTKGRIIADILSKADQYEITCPEGFDLNFIFFPYNDGYEIFITLGTQYKNVIPIGCDFMFICDTDGTITDHVKFHQGAILVPIDKEQAELKSLEHNHVKYPFFSPTEICVFMLYAPSFNTNKLIIYSEDAESIFTYYLNEHTIKTEEL